MSRITVCSPESLTTAAPRRLAPAPAVLAGLRVGVLDNRKPNARLLLAQLAEGVAQRTGARIALITAKTNAAVCCESQVLGQLHDQADVILTGSAD